MTGLTLLKLAVVLPFVAAVALATPLAGRIGDLTYDQARWSVEGENERLTASAKGEEERGGIFMLVTISPAAEASCSPANFPEERAGYYGRTRMSTIKRPGFDIHVAAYDIGCRNWRPPTVEACTTYKDKTYRFSAPVFGCRGGPPIAGGIEAFLETLSGD